MQMLLLDVAVEHVVAVLVGQTGDSGLVQVAEGVEEFVDGVFRQPDVEGFALVHDVDECLHGFVDGGNPVVAVAVKEVDVIEPHAAQALVEAGHEVLA